MNQRFTGGIGSKIALSRRRDSGFALILVLTLLGFLVLLVTSLSVLARSGSEQAELTPELAVARQSARMGLDAALAQLQRYAGPDRRVTAVDDSGDSHLTGVWEADSSDIVPMTWLVSGNADGEPLAVKPGDTTDDWIELLGSGTSGIPRDVTAPLQPVPRPFNADDPEGFPLGRFAWWAGDEGVKASVGYGNRSQGVDYPPFDSPEMQAREIQQIGLGPDAGLGEPLEGGGSLPLIAYDQLALMPDVTGTGRVGRQAIRSHFHQWTIDSRAVLVDTRRGGLRRDLSLRPNLLGAAFAEWADVAGAMEDPKMPEAPEPTPAGGGIESMRRRYRLTAPVSDRGIITGVAPVLSYFLLSFNVRADRDASGGIRPVEVRGRWMLSLWNPYSSALVPEDLEIEVEGLPTDVELIDDSLGGARVAAFSLDAAFGAPFRISLPWEKSGRDDQNSWLPGRVYTWVSRPWMDRGPAPEDGFPSAFYTRNLSAAAGQGVRRTASLQLVANADAVHVFVGEPTRMKLSLWHRNASGGREMLADWNSPEFSAFATTPAPARAATYQFSYFFRLAESIDTLTAPGTWLATPGLDPRGSPLPPEAFVPGANGARPELYPNFTSVSFPDRLLDRALPASPTSRTGQSYNEDVPLFELPRAPLVSLGSLQHLQLAGERPFTIGNSWGATDGWNSIFDRYFLSGLGGGMPPPEGKPWPNYFLIRTALPISASALADSDAAMALLNGAAFNANSTEPEAWTAVLRSVRFPEGRPFLYLAASAATGTRQGTVGRLLVPGSAHFLRFAMSGQETEMADDPTSKSTFAASTTTPPSAPNVVSNANTHLFRRGVRSLTSDEVERLAEAMVAGIRKRREAAGPFRSLEEFLGPQVWRSRPDEASVSVIEGAIAATGLNSDVAEFSSQWLTQADILTALAPMLFVRSDTFLVRTYGDAVNPVTGEVEARAWAEALVQREPEFIDDLQPPETATSELNPVNAALGRRFRVVSFRWLRPEEI